MSPSIPLRLPIQPWFKDHCFNGQAILPAVETMLLLAETAEKTWPQRPVTTICTARFSRFLPLPSGIAGIDAVVEREETSPNTTCLRLLTRKKTGAMSRMIEHCALIFSSLDEQQADLQTTLPPSMPPDQTISAARIYQELVPFGPSYQSLQGQLALFEKGATGTVRAPELPLPYSGLGSPFPLDGTMHAACVHGQRLVDFVPFPVGFATRIIHKATIPGEAYTCIALLQSSAPDRLVYDLQISDSQKNLRETVTGLEMRDVTGGRIRPPQWIRPEASSDIGC